MRYYELDNLSVRKGDIKVYYREAYPEDTSADNVVFNELVIEAKDVLRFVYDIDAEKVTKMEYGNSVFDLRDIDDSPNLKTTVLHLEEIIENVVQSKHRGKIDREAIEEIASEVQNFLNIKEGAIFDEYVFTWEEHSNYSGSYNVYASIDIESVEPNLVQEPFIIYPFPGLETDKNSEKAILEINILPPQYTLKDLWEKPETVPSFISIYYDLHSGKIIHIESKGELSTIDKESWEKVISKAVENLLNMWRKKGQTISSSTMENYLKKLASSLAFTVEKESLSDKIAETLIKLDSYIVNPDISDELVLIGNILDVRYDKNTGLSILVDAVYNYVEEPKFKLSPMEELKLYLDTLDSLFEKIDISPEKLKEIIDTQIDNAIRNIITPNFNNKEFYNIVNQYLDKWNKKYQLPGYQIVKMNIDINGNEYTTDSALSYSIIVPTGDKEAFEKSLEEKIKTIFEWEVSWLRGDDQIITVDTDEMFGLREVIEKAVATYNTNSKLEQINVKAQVIDETEGRLVVEINDIQLINKPGEHQGVSKKIENKKGRNRHF